MKLIIQIPCLNEEDQLPTALAELPRTVDGFDEVEWLIIDDGSTDKTIEVARANGVDHVIKLPQNRGLAAAFQLGLDACLKLGADVIVNTDADNQYDASAIPALVKPIVSGTSDIVVGDRDVMSIDEFSFLKKKLQVLGSWVVRVASDTDVPDATSGFRAYSREAALQLTVVNRYTYTIESIIQAGRRNSAISTVHVKTNESMRESRLFGSTSSYVRRNAFTITRVFAAYEPMKFFGTIAALLGVAAMACFVPFLWEWISDGTSGGHLQSIILGAILFLGAFQSAVLAVIADLISSHRVVSQRILESNRRTELALGVGPSHYLGNPPSGSSTAID